MGHICDCHTGEVEAGESGIQGHLQLYCKVQASLEYIRSCLKNINKKGQVWRGKPLIPTPSGERGATVKKTTTAPGTVTMQEFSAAAANMTSKTEEGATSARWAMQEFPTDSCSQCRAAYLSRQASVWVIYTHDIRNTCLSTAIMPTSRPAAPTISAL